MAYAVSASFSPSGRAMIIHSVVFERSPMAIAHGHGNEA